VILLIVSIVLWAFGSSRNPFGQPDPIFPADYFAIIISGGALISGGIASFEMDRKARYLERRLFPDEDR